MESIGILRLIKLLMAAKFALTCDNSCFTQSVEYFHSDLPDPHGMITGVQSLCDCQAHCQANSDCRTIHFSSNGDCRLKSTIIDVRKGSNSGLKYCADMTDPTWKCVEEDCYHFNLGEQKTVSDAQEACLNIGGKLVEIESSDEMDNIIHLLWKLVDEGASIDDNLLIGMDSNQRWFTDPQNDPTYLNWCNGADTTNPKAVLDNNKKEFCWKTVDSEDFNFICEKGDGCDFTTSDTDPNASKEIAPDLLSIV